MDDLTGLEEHHHCQEGGNAFQRRARLMQSIWREGMGYEMGLHQGRHGERRLGSRLAMVVGEESKWAETTLANYLTETIRAVVRAEVQDRVRSDGKLYGKPRIYCDLLSSQPLCFNLFGELQGDLDLATAVMRDLTEAKDTVHVDRVTAIEFELSPGPAETVDGRRRSHLGDRTAFDVFVRYVTPEGEPGFLGIEVKYHEDMRGSAAEVRPEYDQAEAETSCFAEGSAARLRRMPLQQVWRDHLLAEATRRRDGYREGSFIILRPRDNEACARVVAEYRACLTSEGTFAEWTLEDVVDSLRRHTNAAWVELFFDRYLDFGKVEAELGRATGMEASGD